MDILTVMSPAWPADDLGADPRIGRAILASATDYAIVTFDLEAHITSWNTGATNLFGWSAAEAIGQDAAMIFTAADRLAGVMRREMASAETTGRANDERWHRRKDGSEFWASGEMMMLREEATGVIDGYLKIVRDRTGLHGALAARAAAEEALRANEARLRLAVEGGRMAVWEYDAATDSLAASPELNRLLGYPPDAKPTLAALRARYHPDDLEVPRAAGLAALARGERHFEAEHRFYRLDGALRWLMMRAEIAVGGDGRPTGVRGVVLDVTERKLAEEHRQLLVHELNHRVKNTLAMVVSIAEQTFRNTGSAAEAREGLVSRLMALSKTHDILTEERWEGAELGDVVAAGLAAHGAGSSERIRIEGPRLWLPPRTALSLSMALHELATNAAKYGALSGNAGMVEIGWQVSGPPGSRRLRLSWRESGGPPVVPPVRRGFGSRLIERGLAAELGAEIAMEFAPSGLVCTLDAAVPEH